MDILVLRHSEFEGLGAIATWCEARSHRLHSLNLYSGEVLQESLHFDALIIMGGPQSLREIEKYPYLCEEVNLIRRAIDRQKWVLGVCLGAQLISEAYGTPTEKSPQAEIGFWPITLTKAGLRDPAFCDFPEQFSVGHWHHDQPGLPKQALVLASSPACERQIIRYDERVMGLQCHMEMTETVINGFIDKLDYELKPAPFVQTPEQMRQADFISLKTHLYRFLDQFFVR